MEFLPTAFALVVAGLDFAVAALCWGWPRGELWPLGTRLTAVAMAFAGLTSVAAAMLMGGVALHFSAHLFVGAAILSFVAGTACVIPYDAPRGRTLRTLAAVAGVPITIAVLVALRFEPPSISAPGVPRLVMTFPSAVLFAISCGGFQLLELWAVVTHWPRSHLRSSVPALLLVFVAGFIDVAALLGQPVPLVGAVTAASIGSAYIASRMLAQFRVALEGAEGRVPGYALQRFLGAGGMAEVFMAEAVGILGNKRVAAVKRVRRDLVDNVELCAMFLEEARIAAELHHPNIVEVYSFGTGAPGGGVRPYIAMELVDGVPLATLLRGAALVRLELPMAAVAEIGVSLASALHYAHTLPGRDGKPLWLVHRDVSPHNVLVSRQGEVKLIDFGIARAATRATHTKTGHMRGKLAYASPEQVAGDPVDARSDVFSLGVLLYEAAALTRPFGGEGELAMASAIMQGRYKKLLDVRPDAGALAAVIERAMAHEPDARWQTARELGEALERELGKPLPGSVVLSELFARVVPGEGSRQVGSTPALEMAMTTATSSAPRSTSGDTETVVDSAAAPRQPVAKSGPRE